MFLHYEEIKLRNKSYIMSIGIAENNISRAWQFKVFEFQNSNSN